MTQKSMTFSEIIFSRCTNYYVLDNLYNFWNCWKNKQYSIWYPSDLDNIDFFLGRDSMAWKIYSPDTTKASFGPQVTNPQVILSPWTPLCYS